MLVNANDTQTAACADNMESLTREEAVWLLREPEIRRLKTNQDKAKNIVCSRRDLTKVKQIKIGEQMNEKILNFKYLQTMMKKYKE